MDDVVACITRVGGGAVQDRHLLGMCWEGVVYIDTVLPFGLCSAPLLFTAIADALEWIIHSKGVKWLSHYIDDFITIGAAKTNDCRNNTRIMKATCEETGIPVEPEKDGRPGHSDWISRLGA